MLRINYNLRRKATKDSVLIYMVCRWNGNEIKHPTKIKVIPANFDTKKQRVKQTNADTLHSYKNEILDNMQMTAQKLYLQFYANAGHLPSKQEFKDLLDLQTQTPKTDKNDFWEYIETFIKDSENRINSDTGKTINSRTIQKYKTAFKRLKEFEQYINKPLSFEAFNNALLRDYIQWLTITKGYSKNTTAKYFDNLKTFLNNAEIEGLPVNADFKSKNIKAPREKADTIFLNESELNKLWLLDLNNDTRLKNVRDLFLIGAYTGLRYSDLSTLKQEYIKDNFLHIPRQYKTGTPVNIPLNNISKELLNRHFKNNNSIISNQKFNQYIKEVCKKAGLNEKIETNITKAGQIVTETAPKYSLVYSHTARRSFATNLYLRAVPEREIMRMTGHKTATAFNAYIRAKELDSLKILKNVWE